MKTDPFERFLGVNATATARDLLDLPEGAIATEQIRNALDRQQRRVRNHPDGGSPAAQRVLAALLEAARTVVAHGSAETPLKQTPIDPRDPRRPRRPNATPGAPGYPPAVDPGVRPITLTAFDRRVLATLVGEGGWNSRSRARLVAIASEFNVTMDGLMTVMQGLSGYARAGGHRLAVREITGGEARMTATQRFATPVPQVIINPVEEDALRWRRFVTGSAVISIGVVLLFITIRLLSPEQPRSRERMTDRPLIIPTPELTAEPRLADTPDVAATLFETDSMPTFLGNALPDVATQAADRATDAINVIDLVARKLETNDRVSETVYRDFNDSVETLSRAWILLDEVTLNAAEEAIGAVLLKANREKEVLDRLMTALTPQPMRAGPPIELWQNAYRAGVLAKIAASEALPITITTDVRITLDETLPRNAGDDITGFNDGAHRWFIHRIPELVRTTETDPFTFDRWELWLSALREVADGPAYDRTIGLVIRELLTTGTDLAHDGPSLRVLGRMLTQVDLHTRPTFRQMMLDLYDNRDVTPRDLWVVTSLFAQHGQADWFTRDLVPPADASPQQRMMVRNAMIAQWPMQEMPGATQIDQTELTIPPEMRSRWLTLAATVRAGRDGGDRLRTFGRLTAAARLNAAASALALGQDDLAILWMDEVEALWTRLDDPAQPVVPDVLSTYVPPVRAAGGGGGGGGGGRTAPALPSRSRPGQAIGPDVAWANAYNNARLNTDEKLRLLRALRTTAGTDLGTEDARVFVREVYGGTPAEVRSLAQAMLLQAFSNGPNVGMEMLIQYRFRSMSRDTAEVIAMYAGVTLPDAQDPSWKPAARLALLRQVMTLRRTTYDIDLSNFQTLYDRLSAVYDDHDALVRQGDLHIGDRRPVDETAASLRQSWRTHAESLIVIEPAPATLSVLDRREFTRRQLVDGPIQQFIAEQLSLVDLLAYTACAERPRRRDTVVRLLHEASTSRAQISDVIAQAFALEQLMLAIWTERIESDITPDGGST
jgi:hypothetical protein